MSQAEAATTAEKPAHDIVDYDPEAFPSDLHERFASEVSVPRVDVGESAVVNGPTDSTNTIALVPVGNEGEFGDTFSETTDVAFLSDPFHKDTRDRVRLTTDGTVREPMGKRENVAEYDAELLARVATVAFGGPDVTRLVREGSVATSSSLFSWENGEFRLILAPMAL